MAPSEVIRARINSNIKKEAKIVLKSLGLTISDVMRLMLTRIAMDKSIPKDLFIPQDKVTATMLETREKNLPDLHQ